MNTNDINLAVNQYVHLLWWTDEIEKGIKTEFGEDVYSLIYEIYLFASHDDLTAYNEVLNKMKMQYPFLDHQVATKITNMAAYFWK
ncbi:MAG: hypothetical protein ABIN13_11755 [Mucilaginibacter sp.]